MSDRVTSEAGPRGVSVLKFGSSLLDGPTGFTRVAGELVREVRSSGRRVVAVVSAQRGATDDLLSMARRITGQPPDVLLPLLLRTGEDASAALLGIAVVEAGLDARVMTSDELGLRTTGPLLDADPVGLDLARLSTSVRAHEVTIVPGFVGRDECGVASVLGRGGSDLTALFIGEVLGADEVRLIKDVDGVFDGDPTTARGATAAPCVRFEEASWRTVAEVGGGVVQRKALDFAERHRRSFRVAGVGGTGTLVGPTPVPRHEPHLPLVPDAGH